MKAISNFGISTISKLFISIFILLFNTMAVLGQKSGVWSASGSGAATTWNANAGGIHITASATDYGLGTGYTLNNFTNDTMGCSNSAYSDNTIVGNPSLSVRHTFPNTAQITFNFSKAVENPVMHFDKLGEGQVSSLTSSTLVTVITPGITFNELSGNGSHFVTTPTTIGRDAGQTYIGLPSECGPPLNGTASGSVRLNGVFNTVTLELSMDAVGTTTSVNDRFEIAFSEIQTLALDFDGENDYISREAFLGNKTEATMMTWIKLDNSSDGGDIMGQRNFRIYLDNNNRLRTSIKTNGEVFSWTHTPYLLAPALSKELWYHVAAIYNGQNGSVRMYLNGDLIWEYNLLDGNTLNNTNSWNSDHDFEIGRNSENDDNYFEGSIYETRVYNKALTLNQLQRQIYQKIENNGGIVRGSVVPKDIDSLLWSDLELYYKMDILDTVGQTSDFSLGCTNGNLHGMRTYQDYTAPLPYITKSGGTGSWQDENNWLHGDVWDISSIHSESAIIKVSDNVITNLDQHTVGLIIDSGIKLEINGDSGLFNSWYLKLDGDIDLQGESQLVQTLDSELDVSSSGSLEKDQQGTRDMYTYNYWSSPVGTISTTFNNTSYAVNSVFKDGSNPSLPQNINFITNGYNGSLGNPISIADYWIWKYVNQPDNTYSAWQHVRSTGTIRPGEGFTMKGVTNTSGNVLQEQNYTLRGKPNNGDISLPITSGNDYLVGNPYASAIDANEFIQDNAPTIEGLGNTTGTLYFWEHWGGGSHDLGEYQGGYATYNLSGAAPAAAFGIADLSVDQSPSVGTKLPGRYIPVGQGFFVLGENTGTIKFKNSQRVFKTEATNASIFMRNESNSSSADEDPEEEEEEGDARMKIGLKFNSISTYTRKILLTADENATVGYDWGYDAELYVNQAEDMYWLIEDNKYVIQGINEFTIATTLPLGIHTSEDGSNIISIDRIENIPNTMDIYVHDIELEIFHNLREGEYSFASQAGAHLERFKIVFNNEDTLSVETAETETDILDILYDKNNKHITILNPQNFKIEGYEVFTIIGHSVLVSNDLTTASEIKLDTKLFNTGAYLVKVKTYKEQISKKVIVN